LFIKKEWFTEELIKKIEIAAKPIAEKYGQEIVDIAVSSNYRGQVIKITVGSKKGPAVSDLASITKEFNKFIESSKEKIIPFEFELEVSSPGIDRELRTFRDFYWNEGRTLKVLIKGTEKNINLEGMLIKAMEDKIIMLVKECETEIKYQEIIKAKIKIKF